MTKLNTERFFIANPYSDTHIELFDKFEQVHQITTKTSTYLKETAAKYSKEEYEQVKKQQNEISQSLFLLQNNVQEEPQIIDSCHIMGEKDRKICYIYFAPIKTSPKSRKLVALATDYSFNSLGMEEVFVATNIEDRALNSNLEQMEYSSLGEENGIITYLKEKEAIKDKGKLI